MRIALDAMGRDHAAEQMVKGAGDYLHRTPNEETKVILVGFGGNILLKFVDGMVLQVADRTRDKLAQHPGSQLALPLERPSFRDRDQELDYEEHRGSPIPGAVVVYHGTTSARAINNATRTFNPCVTENLIACIQKGIIAYPDICEERHVITSA
ncbi:MAG: hypothetical protein ACETWG_02730 [Candidatus Neomarinimicrobiota bacterium]